VPKISEKQTLSFLQIQRQNVEYVADNMSAMTHYVKKTFFIPARPFFNTLPVVHPFSAAFLPDCEGRRPFYL
jgi:hypothetical protein